MNNKEEMLRKLNKQIIQTEDKLEKLREHSMFNIGSVDYISLSNQLILMETQFMILNNI